MNDTTTSLTYITTVAQVCNKANLVIDLTNTVNLGQAASFQGAVLINGFFPITIPMNNINEIISGNFEMALNESTSPTQITVVHSIYFNNHHQKSIQFDST